MLIISAFPGCGKSFLKSIVNTGVRVSDSDSSQFDKKQFPQNYIDHIKGLDSDIALVSSHKEVRASLVENKMPFFLCYPTIECKAEYMDRYKRRNSPQPFLDLMDKQFENFVADCKRQTNCIHIEMGAERFLEHEMTRICLIATTGKWLYSRDPKTYSAEDVAGLLTLFAAHLTQLEKPLEVGSSKDAAPMVDVLKDFSKKHNLDEVNPNLNIR